MTPISWLDEVALPSQMQFEEGEVAEVGHVFSEEQVDDFVA